MMLLEKLLGIFDIEGGYRRAFEARKKLRRGCKGIDYGGKPHMFDAMIMLNEIWKNDGKYASKIGVRRCWRKANILPPTWDCSINNDVGGESIRTKTP